MSTALITGASRGVGAQIARALAPTHDLLLRGRGSAELDSLAMELDGSATFPVDLTDYDTLEASVEAIGSLDVLVHCAGVASSLENVADTPVDEWRHVLDVNLVAAAELTRLLLPALRARGGHVVFLNSGAGMRVNPGWTPYAHLRCLTHPSIDSGASRRKQSACGARRLAAGGDQWKISTEML